MSFFSQPKAQTATTAAVKEPEKVKISAYDDPELLAARRKRLQEEFKKRRGRESTRLTSSEPYSRTTLG